MTWGATFAATGTDKGADGTRVGEDGAATANCETAGNTADGMLGVTATGTAEGGKGGAAAADKVNATCTGGLEATTPACGAGTAAADVCC